MNITVENSLKVMLAKRDHLYKLKVASEVRGDLESARDYMHELVGLQMAIYLLKDQRHLEQIARILNVQ